MDPGEFDTLVEIVRPTVTGRDGAREPITIDQPVSKPWAKVVHPGGREFLAGQGEDGVQRVVFRLYSDDRIDTKTIVLLNGQRHDIQDVRRLADVMELHTVTRPPVATP